MLDEASCKKIMVKKQNLKNKLKNLYKYKKKLRQSEILLTHTGVHSHVIPPLPLTEPVRHLVDPIEDQNVKAPVKGPSQDTNIKVLGILADQH